MIEKRITQILSQFDNFVCNRKEGVISVMPDYGFTLHIGERHSFGGIRETYTIRNTGVVYHSEDLDSACIAFCLLHFEYRAKTIIDNINKEEECITYSSKV